MKPSALLTPLRLYREKGSLSDVAGYYAKRWRGFCSQRQDRQDARFLASIRGKYRGRRGFVVGNGPSLQMADLDRLRGEISIASNKIFLAFGQTAWRPTFYTVADVILWPKIKEELPRYFSTIFTPDCLDRRGCACRVRQWPILGLALLDEAENFSADLSRGGYGGSTITFENLQLAAHLGLNPIYIIGCDHSYAGEQNVVRDMTVTTISTTNHFHPDYRKTGEVVNPAAIDVMEEAYRCAREYADKHGIRIFNATRGGNLEIFERCDFDSLF